MNEGQDDHHTQDSAISGLSILEDDTDEFYQKSLEHLQRDKKRMQDAIAGGAQAFRRARLDHRVALNMENLERRNEQENAPPILQAQKKIHRRTASAGDSTASPNVPQQWGRKGKLQKNAFLGRINSSRSIDREKKKEPLEDPDAIYPYKTLFTGDSPDQDFDTADAAVPSVERGSPHRSRTSRRPFHRSRTETDPLRQIMQLEEAGLPDDSPISLRSQRRRVSEGVRFEETEDVEVEDPEGEMQPGALRRLRRPMSSGQVFPISQSTQSFREEGSPERRLHSRPDTVHIESQSIADPLSGGAGRGRSSMQAARPDPKRLSSRDLLRQLARASSSPSPSSRDFNYAPQDFKGAQSDSARFGKQHAGTHALQKDGGVINDKNVVNLGDTRPAPETANASNAPNRIALPTPPPEQKRASPGKTPSPKRTPRVAGAWVGTPTIKAAPLRPCRSDEHLTTKSAAEETETSMSNVNDQPSRPGSALKALIQKSVAATGPKARVSRDSDELGDAAVTSLQEFVASGDPEHTQSLLAMDDDTLELVANVGTPMQFSSKERGEEQLALQRMAQNLRAVRRSVRDATRGITRVEQEVETAGTSKGDRSSIHCEHCQNCSAFSPTLWTVLMATWNSFLRKCYFYHGKDRRIRFTWFGIFLIAMCAWLVSEYSLWYVLADISFSKPSYHLPLTNASTHSTVYCQKRYAGYMIGTGVNIYAPAKPLVTFTILIKRPTRFLWEPAIHALSLFYGVLWRMSGGPEREARKPSFFFLNMTDRPPYDRVRVDKDAQGKLTFWYNLFDWPVPEGEGSIESRISRMVVAGMATPVRPKMTREEWWNRRVAGMDMQLRPTGAAGFPPDTANIPVLGQLRQQELSNDDAM
ncbi:MAG: hypothetical protein M1831_002658 [Alyxoria varia]|nr:MAG: hypothetical protein M1831_002658 [Alyxoria varia]